MEDIKVYTNAYIPKKSDSEKAMTWLSLMEKHLIHFSKEDEDAIDVPTYILTYKGVGNRRTLEGILYCKVDVGRVGKMYADFWIKTILLKIGAPIVPSVPIHVKFLGDKIYKVV